jgi:hypothetical protein
MGLKMSNNSPNASITVKLKKSAAVTGLRERPSLTGQTTPHEIKKVTDLKAVNEE